MSRFSLCLIFTIHTDVVVVKVNLKLGTAESMSKARNVVGLVEQTHFDKVVAAVFRLELLNVEENPDPADYSTGRPSCPSQCAI